MLKGIADTIKRGELTPDQLRAWRQGYRQHLEAKGMAPADAADYAAKVAYNPDLYPTEAHAPALFQLIPPTGEPPKPKAAAAKKLPAAIPAKPKEGPTTPRELKLIEASAIIAGERPSGEDLAFTHAVLCQVGLPRSKVDGELFLRKSGSAWVSVQAGMLDEGNGPVLQPIPYGAMPRLALAWVSTYAKRHGTREVPIGESASEFLALLGQQAATGGTRGSYTTLRKRGEVEPADDAQVVLLKEIRDLLAQTNGESPGKHGNVATKPPPEYGPRAEAETK